MIKRVMNRFLIVGSKIFILIILLMVSSCDSDNLGVIEITSSIENQISHIDSFRLDNIWFDYIDTNGDIRQVILNDSMLNNIDLNKLDTVGKHNISISYKNAKKDIEIILYDEKYLSSNYVFLVEDRIVSTDDYYKIEKPKKKNKYFYNWYIDEELTDVYDDSDYEVGIRLFANWSDFQTFRVRFYYNDIILKEEYVKKGDSATPPVMESFDDYIFSNWDKDFSNISSDIDIYAVYKDGCCEVLFKDGSGVLKREVVKIGDSATPPIIVNSSFIGWNSDYNNITKSCEIFAIYSSEEIKYMVNFYMNEISNESFLYSMEVAHGESIDFDFEVLNYVYLGTNIRLNNITSNLDVIAFYKVKENEYYVDGILFEKRPYYEGEPEIVCEQKDAYWEKSDEIENRYDLVYEIPYIMLVITEYDVFGNVISKAVDYIILDEFIDSINDDSSGKYSNYVWYYDEYYNKKVINYDRILPNTILYTSKK